MTETVLRGGCLCGRLRYELTERPKGVVDCHCGMCRRWNGHVGAYVSVPGKAFRLVAGESELRWYRSSPKSERGFCGHCGSSLFFRDDGRDVADIAAGTLDAPTGLKTLRHIYVADKGDYYDLTDALPRHGQSSA